MGGDGLDGWDVYSAVEAGPLQGKVVRFYSIMLDWGMGGCCMFLGGTHGKARMELGSNGS